MSDPKRPSAEEDLFADKLALLEQLLAAEGGEVVAEDATVIPRRSSDEEPVLSFAQKRLFFLHRWDPEGASYNVADTLELEGNLSVSALKGALAQVVKRHEVLRTTFTESGGEPRAKIAPGVKVQLPVVDLTTLMAPEPLVDRLVQAEAVRPFDLEGGPLVRLTLLHRSPERWILLVTLHHIVADAWSVRVLVEELTSFYAALLAGRLSRRPGLEVQYADFAAWQRHWLEGSVLEEQVAWWREQLEGAPEVLSLPTDHPRPAVRSPRGFTLGTSLPAEPTEFLERLARQQKASPFMLLLALFTAVLARFSRVGDLVVGSPIANRNRPEIEGLIGFFVNTLPLRAHFGSQDSLVDLLARIRETTLAAYDHQDVPFEVLVERLQPERSLSHSPLFQVMMAHQEEGLIARVELEGLTVTRRPAERGTAKFDLTTVFEKSQGRLGVSWEASADLFERATLERLAAAFARFTAAALESPETPLGALPLLDPSERALLLGHWGGPRAADSEVFPLHHAFAAAATQYESSVAVSCEGRTLTYRQLARRAAGVARRLRSLGVGPEMRVGVCIERSEELVVALLGVLGAGGAYVPLDLEAPAERLRYMLEDSAASVVLCSRAAVEKVSSERVRVLVLEDLSEERVVAFPEVAVDPENAAYVIYTSGSTGRPKGVVVAHAQVARLFSTTQAAFDFGPRDIWTLFHSYAFDFSVWELWGALLYGGRLVVVPYLVSRSPRDFHSLLAEEGVTVLNQTPSAFRQLVRVEEEMAREGSLALLALRLVIFGGEALELEALAPWFDRHGEENPRLVNMYGITETTVHVTLRPVARGDLARGDRSPLGRGLADLRVVVVDGRLVPAPVGVVGELCVGGGGVARGYLDRPALTALRFIPDPFSETPGARLYRSGDLARWREGGDLDYQGRLDHQVKVRGFRIELGEIEAAVAASPGLSEAVVVVREDTPGDRRLVAYGVATPGATPDPEALRVAVAARLPEYMVPSAFVLLPVLPLTVNGKLDREALPAPGREDLAAADFAAPEGPVEEGLADIWAEVLGLERVGRHDNFFTLGGDSILSLQVVSRAAERGLDLTLQGIFQHQSLADLAAALTEDPAPGLEEKEEEPDGPDEPFCLLSAEERGALPRDVEDAYPLTRLQAGMLYHMRLDPDHAPYHNVDSWHLRLPFEEETFRRAVALVVAAHPVLRTGFDLEGGSRPLQWVHQRAEMEIRVDDLEHLSEEQQEHAVAECVAQAKTRPFDLSRPCQLRFWIHRRAEDRIQLTLTENHAIFDGWSLYSTLAEIFDLYFEIRGGGKPVLEKPRATFRHFVALEERALASEESKRFWLDSLEGSEPSRLPRDVPSGQPRRSRHHRLEIDAGVADGLRRVAQELGAPLKNLLLAVHLEVLGRFGGSRDVCTGLTYHGRPEGADGSKVRGLFLNTLPFRRVLRFGSWTDLVRSTVAAEQRLFPHRRFPMAEVQRHLGREPFEVAFNFTHFHAIGEVLGSGRVEVLGALTNEGTNLALQAHFNVDPASGALRLELEYQGAELSEALVERLAHAYGAALDALARDPDASRHEAELLTTAERQQVLEGWSGSRQTVPEAEDVYQRFQEEALRSPDGIAVSRGDEAWTYSRLAATSRGLAALLATSGVETEDRVGILLDRSPEMALAVLGILGAGAAFVPLDPLWPDERLAFVLADAAVRRVLTSALGAKRLAALDSAPEALLLEDLCTEPPQDSPSPQVAAEQLAYLIYTSGSTGRPKGVMVPRGGLAIYLAHAVEAYGVAEGIGAPLASPLTFDLSITALLAPLLTGGRVEMIPGEPAVDGLAASLATGAGWSFAKLTPAHLEVLAERPELGAGAVDTLVVGGEALYGALLTSWRRRDPDLRLINEYGPTETVVGCCAFEVPAGAPRPGSVPIGTPIAGARLFVLDDFLRPSPAGVVGQLHVAGPGVSRGYAGRPALTAEKFLPCPHGAAPGERMYATGDRVRWLPSGDLLYIGRSDDQLKVRGHRVEPGEIEAGIAEHAAVVEVVVGVRGEGVGRRLVAWVVVRGELASPELAEHARERLPAALVPDRWHFLEELPLTVHGKVDRRRLPDPEARPEEVVGRAPSGPYEQILSQIWCQVLEVDRVAAEDDFFALGGHSLLASRVAARLRSTLGVEFPLARLFEQPTLEGLARAVEVEVRNRSDVSAAGFPDAPVLEEVSRETGLPLSFAQERLWILDRLEPESAAYNIPALLHLRGELRPGILAHVLARVVGRHEVLRTIFEMRNGRPIQRVVEAEQSGMARVDLDRLPAGVRERAARSAAAALLRRPFDLGHRTLRAALLRVAPEDHLLALALHHIVSDADSAQILVREATALYGEVVADTSTRLPALPIQYADYAVWQRRRFGPEVLSAEVEWWRHHLEGAPAILELPVDRPRPTRLSDRGGRRTRVLGPETTARTRELTRASGSSLFMTLLAVFQALLGRYSNRHGLTVGTPVSGRDHVETENLIGFFVNTLVLRADLRGDPGGRELIERARREVLTVHAHRELPFEKLVEELAPPRTLNATPLFQPVFVLQNRRQARLELPGLEVSAVEGETGTAKFDLTLVAEEREEELFLALEFRRDLFDATTAERILGHYEALLTGMLEQSRESFRRLPILAEEERHQVVTSWGGPELVASEFLLHERFSEVAAGRGASTALRFEGESTSYAELATRAADFAQGLRALGVGPEVKVGLCLERSEELVVTILGVLMAGGAYVPLDPDAPAERLRYILEDCAAPVVVTTPASAVKVAGGTARVVDLEEVPESAVKERPRAQTLSPANAAYVIYTSGSTGRPKGVVVTHGQVARLFTATENHFGFEPEDVWTLFHSYAFDFSVWELWGALLYGGRLVAVPYLVSRSPEDFLALLISEGVTVLNQTPSAFRQLVRAREELASQDGGAELALRWVCFGGEALDLETLRPWWRLHAPERPRLVNLYGITETTVHVTHRALGLEDLERGVSPVGRGLPDLGVYVVDRRLEPAPEGVAGELCVGGGGVSRGYLGRPALTAQRFVPDPFGDRPGSRLYRSGDLARWRGGDLDYLGRMDQQVKVRGFRIELGEIESVLSTHGAVREVAVGVREDVPGDPRLVAYVVLGSEEKKGVQSLREHAAGLLPAYMVPSAIVTLATLPLTVNGKVDRAALLALRQESATQAGAVPGVPDRIEDPLEAQVASIWATALGLETVGTEANFFDLGGHSMLLIEVQGALEEALGRKIPVVDLFTHPTVASLARALGGGRPASEGAARRVEGGPTGSGKIALVGMAGRFPGAQDLETFWHNLCDGVESIRRFEDQQLASAGVPEKERHGPAYVPARAVLDGAGDFDAPFFGFSPREAEVTNPQHRLFLETAWHALEDAACDPGRGEQRIGVFAGGSLNGYWLSLMQDTALRQAVDGLQITLGNDKDYLAARVAYKLDLTGPAVTVQTACSTSLVAVHMACRSLLSGECEMALAGGVSVQVPQEVGYTYQDGGINSPDGHCRAFDAEAGGTVSGDGVGVVALKRLEDAERDGDRIRAVILGSAMNNDGAGKVGFTAPGVEGQEAVIREALASGGVAPSTVGYVEAHGTGTPLGDPVEMAALCRAFGPGKADTVAVGSLKSNVGHMDAAAGVGGLIKTVLALEHGELPPSLHFQRLNPRIDLGGSPFFINDRLRPWPAGSAPRRAGVSSFGIGGTNAHVVLEEAPATGAAIPAGRHQLLVLSADGEQALERATEGLVERLAGLDGETLADVAHTLRTGRRTFSHRRFAVASNGDDAQRRLVAAPVLSEARKDRPVAFLFPGQGAQFPGMAWDLYGEEKEFRRWVDEGIELLEARSGIHLLPLLSADRKDVAAAERLRDTALAQPALFVVEHALARWWMARGVVARAMVGHSLGEYVAAALAGVFRWQQALELVAERGRLMAAMPPGAMLTVFRSESEVLDLLAEHPGLEIAAVNGPALVVLSGPEQAVDSLETRLLKEGLSPRRLVTSHAFHSAMMEPAVQAFVERVRAAELRPPELPFLSNVSGTWITPEEAVDPEYWGRQLRSPVRFSAAVGKLAEDPEQVLLEVGPGRSLTTLVRRHPDARSAGLVVVPSLGSPRDEGADTAVLRRAEGELWAAGVEVEDGVAPGERRKVSLPGYSFARERYWAADGDKVVRAALPETGRRTIDRWFYAPSWRSAPRPRTEMSDPGGPWVAFLPEAGPALTLATALEEAGAVVERLPMGDLDPRSSKAFREFLDRLSKADRMPRKVLFAWGGVAGSEGPLSGSSGDAFFALLHLGQALAARQLAERVEIVAITEGASASGHGGELAPAAALLFGLGKVTSLEAPDVSFRSIDLAQDLELTPRRTASVLQDVVASQETSVAWRLDGRKVEELASLELPLPNTSPGWLRPEGVYLITGGFGEVGSLVAEHLARRAKARLVLVSRTPLSEAAEDDARRRQVEELEALGSQVLSLVADATDRLSMGRAVARAGEHFGRLDGLIHAAGARAFDREAGIFHPLDGLDAAECERQIGMRARSLEVLAELAEEVQPDFCLVMSSLAAVVGLLGSAAYPAAHLWVDAFARQRDALGSVPWLVVGWDNLESRADEAAARPLPENEPLVLRREAGEVLDRVLAADGLSQVVVSSFDLEEQIHRWVGAEGPAAKAVRTQHIRPDLDTPFVAPRFEVETVLAEIWCELLGLDRVGVDDDFFRLGGDSVISIQMIARARQRGVEIQPQQIFERPTVSGLAEVAGSAGRIDSEQGAVTGEMPLIPIQRWFFELGLEHPEHWNQAMLLTVPAQVKSALLGRALGVLLAHHDVLRLGFPNLGGPAIHAAVGAQKGSWGRVDLAALAEPQQEEALVAALAAAHRGFDLATGPLVRGLHFDQGPRPGRLALLGHHLVCDAVSWRILLEDLAQVYADLEAGRSLDLPAKTTSFSAWALRLEARATDPELLEELPLWESAERWLVEPLPRDLEAGEDANREADLVRHEVSLEAEVTAELSGALFETYGIRPHEALLAALVGALGSFSGQKRMLIDVEGHGREPLFSDVDLSRTVGWFTALFPVLFLLPEGGEAIHPAPLFAEVKESMRAVPGGGLGWGLLRYLGPEAVRHRLADLPRPEVSYLYLGQVDGAVGSSGGMFVQAPEGSGAARSPEDRRSHLLDVKAAIRDGVLRVVFESSRRLHSPEAIRTLADDTLAILRRGVSAAQGSEEEVYNPSDFQRVDLDQEELDDLLSELQEL